MSRIGKKLINIEPDVTVKYDSGRVHFNGPKGQLELKLPDSISVEMADDKHLKLSTKHKRDNHLLGLFRTLLQNANLGVKNSWSKTLELVGVGFRASTSGSELELNLGFSHPIKLIAPTGISFQVEENKITVLGVDKYLVGEQAAKIRKIKPPEPYKGKGIRYLGEYIRKKLGKAAKVIGAAGAK